MQSHIAFLKGIAAEHTFEQYSRSRAMQYACRYALLVVAEAANHLPAALRQSAPDVPWRSIISIGHKLRHEYHRIDEDVIWDILANHLEPLDSAVRQLLTRTDLG
jgi:uncharacterized protein with HEPN domain